MTAIKAAFERIGEENAFAVLARAAELQRQGRDIINLGIGQPDFKTPAHIPTRQGLRPCARRWLRICIAALEQSCPPI